YGIYGAILAGSAVGLALGYALGHSIGITSLMAVALALCVATAVGARAGNARGSAVGAASTVALLLAAGVTDTPWLHRALAVNWHGQEFEHQGFERVYERWGRFGLFTIREKHDEPGGLGFYNDILHWG